MSWHPFDNGETIGKRGSEDGVILSDEEYDRDARITLERDCMNQIPFAVTCGIYGWFFHTRFVGTEQEADVPGMRQNLASIIEGIPLENDPSIDAKRAQTESAIASFVERFP